ncbi:MAG TPA: hypothetical protein VHR64_12765 [Thermomicrobiales bacterium]|jgi:hypothetical protein|nr:hypothetical protein [Thermomicrobiales bacterium]
MSTTPTDTKSTGSAADQPEPAKRSDRDSWAKPVSQLSVSGIPDDAINLNVEGRRVAGPAQGFGRMWRKRHHVRLDGLDVAPQEVISTWKSNFGSFWPSGNRFYGPITGLLPGDVAVINLAMPGKQKLSTGVLVLYADDESFSLMTPQGHVFAGWITFSSYTEDSTPIVQAEILMRASDPIFEIGMEVMGHKRENAFWEQTLRNVASHFGIQGKAITEVECVDPHRQWRYVTNVWQNSQIRTALYMPTIPFRAAARRFR